MPKVLVKERVWPGLRYHPHTGQKLVHASSARHRVNAAGRRFGKSQVGGHELIPEALIARTRTKLLSDLGIRMEYWIVGPNYTDSEKEFRVFYDDCRRLRLPFDKPGTYNDPRSGNLQVSLWEGRFLVQAKSAAHPESLVGEGLHGVIMAEAAKMKESVWSKYVRPTLADFTGWSLWNSTPEGKNFFYDLWQLGQNPEAVEWESWKQPSWTNPFVFPEGRQDPEVHAMRLELGETLFEQEVACSFTEYAGRVYFMWDEEVHVRDLQYDPHRPVFMALDYGYTNPTVILWLQVDAFQNVNVLREYYHSHKTESDIAEEVLADPILGGLTNVATAMYPDPEDPGATAYLSNKFRVRAMGGTGGELKDRIALIRKWLEVPNSHLPFDHPERLPKLRVDRHCTNLIREMDAYRYPNEKQDGKENVEKPLKKDDHAPEALSRFFKGYFGAAPVGARVRKARVG